MKSDGFFTNQYVNRTNAPLSLAIQSGVPYYWAVLLDNTNFGSANWTAYTSSNITANLGTVQGWHTVWVGLGGPPAGSLATWNAVRLDLDLSAPILVVRWSGLPLPRIPPFRRAQPQPITSLPRRFAQRRRARREEKVLPKMRNSSA